MTPWFGAWATGRVGLSFTEKVKIKGGPHRVLLCFLFTYCNCGFFFFFFSPFSICFECCSRAFDLNFFFLALLNVINKMKRE